MLWRNAVIIIGLSITLTACAGGKFYPFWAKPYSLEIRNPPPGPPAYQQGYTDGCESGFKGYARQYNKVWWEFRQDEKYRNDPVYYQIWKDAYAYCAAYGNSASMHGVGNNADDGWLPFNED